jgi:hypothetical protein
MKYPELHSNLMVPPKGADIEITSNAVNWFDQDGVFCSMSFKGAEIQSMETMIKEVENLKIRLKGEKVCMLSVLDGQQKSNKEVRDYAAEILPEFITALALVTESILAKMTASIFFSIKKQNYPVKMFTDVAAAKNWLKQYL